MFISDQLFKQNVGLNSITIIKQTKKIIKL